MLWFGTQGAYGVPKTTNCPSSNVTGSVTPLAQRIVQWPLVVCVSMSTAFRLVCSARSSSRALALAALHTRLEALMDAAKVLARLFSRAAFSA